MNNQDNQTAEIIATFGNRLRTRVCGICVQDDKVLMIKHNAIGKGGHLWAPPGGGVNYGETTEDALIREFKEETGLGINIEKFLFVHEFLRPPLHGIELFFQVSAISGKLKKGTDPEMTAGHQIIDQIAYLTFPEIKRLPKNNVHHLFTHCGSIEELIAMAGIYKFIELD